jgi:hypothetical protein
MKDYSPKRTGNEEAHVGKRAAFKEGKKERSGLADSINRVLSNMKVRDSEDSKLEGKAPNVAPRKFSK